MLTVDDAYGLQSPTIAPFKNETPFIVNVYNIFIITL